MGISLSHTMITCKTTSSNHVAFSPGTQPFYYILLLVILSTASGCSAQKIIAFPGAEGFGKFATGGRGGKIIYVTNLNDDGPGSLRRAIREKTPRIILFSVSGNIELTSALDINHGNVTIAGQSAPGDGICLKNYPLTIKDDNVIVRFLRLRLGDESQQEADAISGNNGVNNVIIDHCSISWATDECASFYRNKNFTMQWCIISESLNQSVHAKGNHGYGGIWGGEGASFHHNLLVSHTSRMPRFSGSETTPNTEHELVDFSNNVIYNWKSNNAYGGESGRYNITGNYYKPGPATRSDKHQIINPWPPFGKFYVNGNYFFNDKEISEKNSAGVIAKDSDSVEMLVREPFTVEPIIMHAPEEAYDLILKKAGASLHRDEVDKRIVSEVSNSNSSAGKDKNGIIDSQQDVGGWPLLKAAPAPADTDQDGMPDEWETGNGLDPANPADALKSSLQEGYTNVEVYLNSLVDPIMK